MKILRKNETWVLSDRTKGMENQSIALAKMFNYNFKLIHYDPPYLLKKFPLLGKIYFPYSLKKILKSNVIPSYIITTGKRMAGASIALKSNLKKNVKTIHIQNPKLSLKNFDLLLIPEHDNISASNVIQTKGALSFFCEEDIKKVKETPFTKVRTKNKLVLLMVGGKSKKYEPQNSEYYDLCTKVIKGVKSVNGQLIVVVSRRTPEIAIKILETTFSKHLNNYQIFSPNEYNPYPNILKSTDYIIVTSDSVNMISETATIPTPLFISHFSKENQKILNFIKNLKELNVIRSFEGELFDYEKKKIQTNENAILQVNKFFGF